jgi:hypothetical protein
LLPSLQFHYISEDFKNDINIVFESLNKWFGANKLSLNFDKTHYIQFTTKNSRQIDLEISYAKKLISDRKSVVEGRLESHLKERVFVSWLGRPANLHTL